MAAQQEHGQIIDVRAGREAAGEARWRRDQHGTVHVFDDDLAYCDVVFAPAGRGDEGDPLCQDCLALARPHLGFEPSWMRLTSSAGRQRATLR